MTAYEMRISDWSSDVCPSDLSEEMLLNSTANERFGGLRKMHGRLGWRINAVEQTDRVEQVYCAEVKGTHAFALDDNILTSNCFGCSAHGDAIRWMTDQRGLSFTDAVKELADAAGMEVPRSEEHTSELQSLMRISYAVFCLK